MSTTENIACGNHVLDRVVLATLGECQSDLLGTPIHSAVARITAENVHTGIALRRSRGQSIKGHLALIDRMSKQRPRGVVSQRIAFASTSPLPCRRPANEEMTMKREELPTIVGPLQVFVCGSNAGGGSGVLIRHVDGRTEKVYRYITRSVGGRPCDTREETARWIELRRLGLICQESH